jgi:predicted MPP superfamily phosphohydrolase
MIFLLLTVLVAEIWLWYALVSDLKNRPRALQAAVYIIKSLLSAALLYLAVRILFYKGDFADPPNAFRQIAFGALGAFLITAATAYVIIRLATWLIRKAGGHRLKKNGLLGIIIFCVLVALFADSYFRQRFNVNVVRREIAIKGLERGLRGMKIVLVSDLHLSSWYGHYVRLNGIMDLINDEKPDLLINAGDFITYGWKEFGGCDTILSKAHAADGAFAVDGNHDDGTYHPRFTRHYSMENEDMLSHSIISSGYTLLRDTTVFIMHDSSRVAIAGIDTRGHHFDISYGDFGQVLSNIPDSVFTILLLHAPSGWDQVLEQEHVPDLTLSGHTHGMQIGLPVPGGYISPASLIHKYWKGLYNKGDHYLYVTTGLGTMGMALRIFMPPEIAVLTLTDS